MILFKICVAYLPSFAKFPPLVRAGNAADKDMNEPRLGKIQVTRDNEEKRNKTSIKIQILKKYPNTDMDFFEFLDLHSRNKRSFFFLLFSPLNSPRFVLCYV